jgi:hypothetical protein
MMAPELDSSMTCGVTCYKDASVVDCLEFSNDSHQWNVNFLRAIHDWEVDFFASFFNLLYSFRMRQGDEDKLCWVPSKRGLFDVKSYYNVLVPMIALLFLGGVSGEIRLS